MPTTPAARQTEQHEANECARAIVSLVETKTGKSLDMATCACIVQCVGLAMNSTGAKELRAALQAYEAQFEALFGHCLSNGIFNQWQKPFDCTGLNDAHLKATQALANAG